MLVSPDPLDLELLKMLINSVKGNCWFLGKIIGGLWPPCTNLKGLSKFAESTIKGVNRSNVQVR